MHTFFHGWRRKAGVLSLVIALATAGMWARSRVIVDTFEIRPNDTSVFAVQFHLRAFEVEHRWRELHTEDLFLSNRTQGFHWISNRIYGSEPQQILPSYRRGRYVAGNSHLRGTSEGEMATLTVPYSTSVLSLTLLSAYLILWKSRKKSAHA